MLRFRRIVLFLFCSAFFLLPAHAAFDFEDTRFQGVFTTENLDMILQEYNLLDGWYWTTPANTVQTFQGVPDAPGWTETSVIKHEKSHFNPRYFGNRWGINQVLATSPGSGGYGECFGFAQFVGYLLSGDVNPQKNWDFFYSVDNAGGLKVGDIIRVEYRANRKYYQHSAVVYAINGEEILFLQVSGSNYNRISVGKGFSDGNHLDEASIDVIASIPGIKICRSPLNR